MHNKLRIHKRGGTRNPSTHVSKPFRKPDSVKEVLRRACPTLARVSDQAGRQSYWRQWLTQQLAPQLTSHLSGVVEREDTLVIFTDSAAWSARLRYCLQELEAQIKQAQPTIQHVSVRVMPKT
jgi:hypothetical protein